MNIDKAKYISLKKTNFYLYGYF